MFQPYLSHLKLKWMNIDNHKIKSSREKQKDKGKDLIQLHVLKICILIYCTGKNDCLCTGVAYTYI